MSQADRLEVLGPHTSGEIEYVIVAMDDGLWVTVGSDQTDRKAEQHGVALSKQLAGKVLGRTLWRLDELRERWDSLVLRAHVMIDGERVLYQEGALALMRTPDDLMQRYGQPLKPGTIMMSGTLNAIGGIRPAFALRDAAGGPCGRAIHHARLRHRRAAGDRLAATAGASRARRWPARRLNSASAFDSSHGPRAARRNDTVRSTGSRCLHGRGA